MAFMARCFLFLLWIVAIYPAYAAKAIETDICVFGGSSAGIVAAIQASRMGKSAVLVEPGKYLGGLTTGGLGATDIGNKAAVGGISHEFYHRIALHYANEANWKWESKAEYFARRGSGQSKASDLTSADATMWTFEPHVGVKVFREMLQQAKIPVHLKERLAAVRKEGTHIAEIKAES